MAWLLLAGSVSLHVIDEALTGFLSIYNPTVLELHQRVRWLYPPTFTFEAWLAGLIIALGAAFLLTPLAFHFPRAFRPLAILCAVLMIINGCGHLVGTALGRTFSDIHFARPMPGTYSSPFMIAAAIYLLICSWRLRTSPQSP